MSEIKILEEKTIYKKWLNIMSRTIKHPNGGEQTYEIVNPGLRSVCVVAFDEFQNILTVEQYRFGPNKRLTELPAGRVNNDEPLADAMARELLEETGYSGDLTEVGSHYVAAENGATRHVFVAKNCKKVAEPKLDQSEIDEGLEVKLLSLDEFKALARSGQLTETGAAFMALDYLKLL
ncbi:MAG TPA: hypothetical protein DHW71_03525 [Gammaproteobacteria bacterium]|nr:hypothetical protein [Gammaproteobacteria bacterium]MEC8010014.1 NUDIX hydrolase [Pseudomonadota bacterium]HBF10142.1 hypothetical protein [Gammaproteobacteria bacterium]HCK92029.1 hypothetical protein [Gammaproteobacteria bacterium]|tara:strand:+ start:1876 stop:2409 length:534 start_codon:yes stop_codon:yes gene_type:complete